MGMVAGRKEKSGCEGLHARRNGGACDAVRCGGGDVASDQGVSSREVRDDSWRGAVLADGALARIAAQRGLSPTAC